MNEKTTHEVTRTIVDLSHPLQSGRRTYDWMPAPEVTELLSRENSRPRYAGNVEFVIHQVALPGSSGTYIDAPFHRFGDGADLAALPLEQLVDLPGLMIDIPEGAREIAGVQLYAVRNLIGGAAVLFRTGQEHKWDDPSYSSSSPFLGEQAARLLADLGAAVVGIDALNIDSLIDPKRPAHSILLGANIPIIENLRGLDQLSGHAFRFTAAPVGVAGCSSFPVRAFAIRFGRVSDSSASDTP